MDPINGRETTKELVYKEIIDVPSEAAGRVIGKDGANLNALREIEGMAECRLIPDGANSKKLIMQGSKTAIDEAIRTVNDKIMVSKRQLRNASRKVHSYSLSGSGELRTPAQVHQTGDRPPKPHTTGVGKNHYAAKMQGKHSDKLAERAKAERDVQSRK